MSISLGDRAAASTIYCHFTTVDADGVPTTLSGTPVVSVYKDASDTQFTTGVTLSADADSRTGFNRLTIDTNSGSYGTGDYSLVITTGTVDGTSVVGYVVATFSIGKATANVTAITDAIAQKIAHIILRRTMVNVEASSDGDTLDVSSLYGMVQAILESNTTAHDGKLTVYRTDGSTELAQKTIDTDADADLIVGMS